MTDFTPLRSALDAADYTLVLKETEGKEQPEAWLLRAWALARRGPAARAAAWRAVELGAPRPEALLGLLGGPSRLG